MDSRLLDLMDDVYSENNNTPILLALFGEKFRQKALSAGINIPQDKKLSNLIEESGKYERFKPYPTAAWWIQRKGQESVIEPFLSSVQHNLLMAFLNELPEGLSRYYHIIPPYNFIDTEISPSDSDYIKIEQDNFPSIHGKNFKDLSREEYKLLAKYAIDWAQSHNLPASSIYYSKRNNVQSLSLLTRIINTLSDSEKKRIVLPLDIIDKLSKIK